mmetsp:Transcript_84662/g.132249  ORF Transcript_84662/g.132249 Transcript_84662/m.132249 type:complete len:369 (-) Transcript_84662:36-1142(-)
MLGSVFLLLGWLSSFYPFAATRIDMRHVSQHVSQPESDGSFRCPKWLCADLLGFLFDVKVYHKFPDEEKMMTKLEHIEERILKLTGEATLWGARAAAEAFNLSNRMEFMEISDDATENDLAEEFEKNGGDLPAAVSQFFVQHQDQCMGDNKFPAAHSPEQIFNNIKAVVDTFNIFTKCTKSYVKRIEDGRPQIRKDDVIAVSTELASGVFSRSFEDVSQYQEYYDHEGVRHLIAIVSSRKENVIEGNYDIVVRQYPDRVHLQYTKRQNLAEPVLRRGITKNGYAIVTQHSVDKTIRKLAYAGLYGGMAIEFGAGCMDQVDCVEYEMKDIGEKCKYSMQCKSHSCKRSGVGRSRECQDKAADSAKGESP